MLANGDGTQTADLIHTMREALPSLIAGLVIAVVSAIVTVRLALRRFYSEQWWGRKAQAYVEILGALFKVKAYLHARGSANDSAMALAADEEKNLFERSREGSDELLRASAVGVLFISQEAQARLEAVLPVVQNSWLPDSYESVEPTLKAVDSCIEDLRRMAKTDLRGH